MNAIAAHKHELERLLEDLSGDIAFSKITFLALVDAYITRLDTNCSDNSARVDSVANANKQRIKYGTNIDSELRALLRAALDFKTARRVFPKISRCGPQASVTRRQPTRDDLFRRLPARPGQGPLSDVGQCEAK
jgi:hypothetical protein